MGGRGGELEGQDGGGVGELEGQDGGRGVRWTG